MTEKYLSWGRYPRVRQQPLPLVWRDQPLARRSGSLLPYGLGRSYGDVCLNAAGHIVPTRALNHFMAFDAEQGLLQAEAGVSLAEVLQLIVPQGWFVPVTPGTRFVTLGGMLANDVHGKNHHRAGTFGRHVRRFELLRSDGQRLLCSREENAELFAATIGGLGLTGLVTWLELALKKIPGPELATETIRFGNLDEFFALSRESDQDWEYTVAWIDSQARGRQLGRGLFMRGNHTESARSQRVPPPAEPKLSVPVDAPAWVLNRYSVKLFNNLYYRKQTARRKRQVEDLLPFFYPLDSIGHWNPMYGKRGFLQYQCVVPSADGQAVTGELLQRCARAGQGSFLSVLKIFGEQASPGMLSFPRPGVTLALDFPLRGARTLKLLDELDAIVGAAGGAVYPAKDARMSGASFRQYFPRWKEFARHVDPDFGSDFWRRVNNEAATS